MHFIFILITKLILRAFMESGAKSRIKENLINSLSETKLRQAANTSFE